MASLTYNNSCENKLKKSKYDDGRHGKDRISQLPTDLLHHIISCLQLEVTESESLKSAARFGVSSKACRQAWLSCPYMSFSYHPSNVNESEIDFVNRVSYTLLRTLIHGRGIRTFCLCTYSTTPIKYHLNLWMQWIDQLKVSILDLNLFNCNLTLSSNFTYLQELNLRRCHIKLMEQQDCSGVTVISFPSLRKLCLSFVHTSMDTIEGIVQGSPLLERLEIVSCYQLLPSHVYDNFYHNNNSNDNLFQSVFKDFDGCSDRGSRRYLRLKEFSCHWIGRYLPCFDAPSLSGLIKLSLTGSDVLNDKQLQNLLTQFTRLEYLSIRCCNRLKNPRFSSCSITQIELVSCVINGVVHICCPNLHIFSYRAMNMPRIHQESCSQGWKLDLNSCLLRNTNKFFLKLRKLFQNTNTAIISCLQVDINTKNLNENQLRLTKNIKIAQGEYTKLNNLKLILTSCHDFPFRILDAFLWICHPEYISLTFVCQNDDDFNKVLNSIKDMVVKILNLCVVVSMVENHIDAGIIL